MIDQHMIIKKRETINKNRQTAHLQKIRLKTIGKLCHTLVQQEKISKTDLKNTKPASIGQ